MSGELLLGLGLGALLGLVFSALGAGGGLLATPVLLFVFRLPVTEAAGASLAVLFAAALVSAIAHHRRGNVDAKLALVFGGAALLGAPLGAWLHRRLPERVLLALFCAVLLFAAVRMWLQPSAEGGRFSYTRAALGFPIGALSGLLGVGGGFLIVPALTSVLGVPVRRAIGTSTAIVCVTSLSGAAAYSAIDARVIAMAGGAALGALAGVPLSGRVPERLLRKGFAVLALLILARMLYALALPS